MTSPAQYCDKHLDTQCFVAGHFDWCLEHETPSLDADGTRDVHHIFQIRDGDGSEVIKTEIIQERKCSHVDASVYGGCLVVVSGKMIFTESSSEDAEPKVDYSNDEWEEEERVQWISEQMAEDSP